MPRHAKSSRVNEHLITCEQQLLKFVFYSPHQIVKTLSPTSTLIIALFEKHVNERMMLHITAYRSLPKLIPSFLTYLEDFQIEVSDSSLDPGITCFESTSHTQKRGKITENKVRESLKCLCA